MFFFFWLLFPSFTPLSQVLMYNPINRHLKVTKKQSKEGKARGALGVSPLITPHECSSVNGNQRISTSELFMMKSGITTLYVTHGKILPENPPQNAKVYCWVDMLEINI